MFGDGDEKRRLKHGDRGDHRFVHRDTVAVAFAHLGANGRIGQVEVADLLKAADLNAEGTVVCLPDKFRTVESVIRPLEGEVVWPTREPMRLCKELPECCWRKDGVSAAEALDDEVMTSTASDPLVEWSKPNRGNSLEDEGFAAAMNDQPHVAVLRPRSSLNGERLRRTGGVKDDVAIPDGWDGAVGRTGHRENRED